MTRSRSIAAGLPVLSTRELVKRVRIRGAIAAIAVAVALWLVLYVQLKNGDDPGLKKSAAVVQPAIHADRHISTNDDEHVADNDRHDNQGVVSFPEVNWSFPCFGGEANVHVGFAKSDPGPMRLIATRRPDTGRLVIEQSPDGHGPSHASSGGCAVAPR